MKTLRSQVLFLLGLMFGSLLVAKTLVDTSRIAPRIHERARAEARIALLQAGPGIERAYKDGRLRDVRAGLARLATVAGPGRAAILDPEGGIRAASDPTLERSPAAASGLAWGADFAVVPDPQPATQIIDETLRAAVPIRLGDDTPPDPELVGPVVPSAGSGALAFENDLSLRFTVARNRVATENALMVGLAFLMLWLLSIALRSELEQPARRIVEALDQFAAGDRAARTGLKGRTEIVRIGKAFDSLADRLQASEKELLDTQVRLDRTMQALPIGIMVVRREDGRPFFVNPRWRELFGIPEDASRDVLSLLSLVRCERQDGTPYPIEELPIPAVLRTGARAEARDLWVRRDDQVLGLALVALPVSLSSSEVFDAVVALASPADAATPVAVPSFASGEASRATTLAEFASVVVTMEAVGIAKPAAPPAAADRDTVLVANGDRAELDSMRRSLERADFRVLAAADGEQAMVFFGREGPTVRAVLLDLAMPGTSGEMLLDEILALDPAARVVALSGYRPDLPMLAASGRIAAFLARPVSEGRLLDAIRQALGAPVGASR